MRNSGKELPYGSHTQFWGKLTAYSKKYAGKNHLNQSTNPTGMDYHTLRHQNSGLKYSFTHARFPVDND